MAISRVADPTSEGKIDSHLLPKLRQVALHHLRPLRAKLALIVQSFVDARLGRVRVEIERVPDSGEGVIGILGFVRSDCAIKTILAHIAPWAHSIGDDINLEVRHHADGGAERQIGDALHR